MQVYPKVSIRFQNIYIISYCLSNTYPIRSTGSISHNLIT